MRINCTIDDTFYSMNVNANKPLNRILEETIESFASNSTCLGANCGNCVVILNGVCTLSCLVPAFKMNNAVIQTYEGFSKTRNCHDIERAYQEAGINPCRQCYASKTLLIESILHKIEEEKLKAKKTFKLSGEFVAREMSLNICKCMDSKQLEKVIVLAYQNRSRRRGKA